MSESSWLRRTLGLPPLPFAKERGLLSHAEFLCGHCGATLRRKRGVRAHDEPFPERDVEGLVLRCRECGERNRYVPDPWSQPSADRETELANSR